MDGSVCGPNTCVERAVLVDGTECGIPLEPILGASASTPTAPHFNPAGLPAYMVAYGRTRLSYLLLLVTILEG